jgi:hypothetical protein
MNIECVLCAHWRHLGTKKATSIEVALALGLYVKRWQRWVAVGLQNISTVITSDP